MDFVNIVDHTSHPPKPSPDTTHSQSCDHCRLTTCHSLHDYSGSSCPYNICPECRELEVLDAKILEVHNLLVNLSLQRHELKERINRRHDHFTSNLPNEVISHIFTFVVDEPSTNRRNSNEKRENTWNPVLVLGAVCRRWRDITLAEPELWTTVRINPRKLEHTSSQDMTALWFSRSCAVPLSLDIDMTDRPQYGTIPVEKYSDIVPLLRSQAPRWKHLTLRLPSNMFQMLLNGLEDRLIVDSLVVYIFNSMQSTTILNLASPEDDLARITIAMKYPFVPTRLYIQFAPVTKVPILWDNLTDLTADCISVDDMVHIFRHAHNLQRSQLTGVKEAAGHYPLPVAPVTHTTITKLTGNITAEYSTVPFLNYLTLPSLETLHYKVENDNPLKIQVLADFLDRCRPPLRELFVNCYDRDPLFGYRWFPVLPSITSLYVGMFLDLDGIRTEQCVRALALHLNPIALPCLRELMIHSDASRLGPYFWHSVADMFPDPASNSEQAPPMVLRPLKTVRIDVQMYLGATPGVINRTIFHRLKAIQDSGITLKVLAGSLDMLGPRSPLTLYDAEEI